MGLPSPTELLSSLPRATSASGMGSQLLPAPLGVYFGHTASRGGAMLRLNLDTIMMTSWSSYLGTHSRPLGSKRYHQQAVPQPELNVPAGAPKAKPRLQNLNQGTT